GDRDNDENDAEGHDQKRAQHEAKDGEGHALLPVASGRTTESNRRSSRAEQKNGLWKKPAAAKKYHRPPPRAEFACPDFSSRQPVPRLMSAPLSIAFIGTGVMGRSMAGHLQKAGHRLHVYNRTREKAQALVDGGAQWHDNAGSAAAAADVVI